jgi:hypothetical protein
MTGAIRSRKKVLTSSAPESIGIAPIIAFRSFVELKDCGLRTNWISISQNLLESALILVCRRSADLTTCEWHKTKLPDVKESYGD